MILTNHEERHSEVFSARGLHGSKDRPHNCTANAHKCNHHDEPADADGLGDGDAAAGLDVRTVVRDAGLLVLLLHVVVTGPANSNNVNTRKLLLVRGRAWRGRQAGRDTNSEYFRLTCAKELRVSPVFSSMIHTVGSRTTMNEVKTSAA